MANCLTGITIDCPDPAPRPKHGKVRLHLDVRAHEFCLVQYDFVTAGR